MTILRTVGGVTRLECKRPALGVDAGAVWHAQLDGHLEAKALRSAHYDGREQGLA